MASVRLLRVAKMAGGRFTLKGWIGMRMPSLFDFPAFCSERQIRHEWRGGCRKKPISALQCFALLLLAIFISPQIRAQASAGSALAARYIVAVQKGDLKTLIDLSAAYQDDISKIKAQNPQVLWPKLTKEYYDTRIAQLSTKSDTALPYLQGMMSEPDRQIRFMQSMVQPNAKWKVSETRADQARDPFDGHEYQRTVAYITVTFPTLNDSPFIDGKFVKEMILEIDLNAKTQQVSTLGRIAKGDTSWESRVTVMNAKWAREGLAGMGHLTAEAFGGKAPYTWKAVCGSYDLSKNAVDQPADPQGPVSLVIDLQRFPRNAAFPLHCSMTVADGSGQSDAIGITVSQMLTGASEFCYVREPWFSRGQGFPAQSNMCLHPIKATDSALDNSPAAGGAVPVPIPADAPTPSVVSSVPPSACGDYEGCMKAGLTSYQAADWATANADFQAAAVQQPTKGNPWLWLGNTLLRDGQAHEVADLAKLWDKSIDIGDRVRIEVCHERTLQPCERGGLFLSRDAIHLSGLGIPQVFSVSPSEVEPGRILNNSAAAHISYSMKVGGKNYAFDFVPPGLERECTFNLMVQCPASGIAKQLLLAEYVAQTLPKLVAKRMGSSADGGAPASVSHDRGQSNGDQPGGAANANGSQVDTILIPTDSGAVRVKNFHRLAKGKDEFDDEILEKTPMHVIDYGAEMMCFEDSPRKGCFGIDLTDKSNKSDEVRSQQWLMDILGVSLQDFCKLPVAVSSIESSVEGTKVATPPGICPKGQSHFQ